MHTSQSNKDVENNILPRFMPLTMFWSVWTSFMFKWPRWWRLKLECTIARWSLHQTGCICSVHLRKIYFVQVAFVWHNCNGFVVANYYKTTVHVEMRFQNIQQKSKLACNFGTWNASSLHIRLILPLTIPSTTIDPISIASTTLLSVYHSNAHCVERLSHTCLMRAYAKSCAWWLLNPWSTCTRFRNVSHRPSQFSLFCFPCSLLCSKKRTMWYVLP